ncbi:condensation domain-containing protein [Streptomyces netropsis]|uniref:Non-ribosomal peptide synthetase component F n=1 Tax=Streptomyces netropsis TaxID=55404 RepID=A0A7W7LEW0_STRNE|nr:condensation domain-containing protein [Streptomyces netropsis]MBB4888433.1 non-ribosomal peptide synthetase component F [Streptomyces netropsis]GGR29333.1 hypothetical protein GCM10010219_37640 [Streptomyces netropsis]
MTTEEAGIVSGGHRVPLSPGQQAMWVAWQVNPQQWTHIIPLAFDVQGDLDTDELRSALGALNRRYPQLRGRIVVDADGLPALDWSAELPFTVTESYTDEPVEQAARTAWQRPFELERGPLLRADVIRHRGGTLLLIAVHHLICDGTSVLTVLEALTRAWAGEELGSGSEAAELGASAEHTQALAEGPQGEDHRRYWERVFSERPPSFELPPAVETTGYQVLGSRLDPALLARIDDLAGQLDVRRFAVMFAAFFVLLRRYGGQDHLLASTPFHGRVLPGTRHTVGYFVNALPVVQTVTAHDEYATVITRLDRDMRDTLRHGALPLPAIMRAAGLTGPDAHSRTHQALFQWWDAGRHSTVDVRALRLTGPDGTTRTLSMRDLESTADYRMALMLRGDKGGVSVLWKDPNGTMGPTLLTAMSADYVALLRDICAHPGRRIQDVAAVLDPAAGQGGDDTAEAHTGPAADGHDRPGRPHPDDRLFSIEELSGTAPAPRPDATGRVIGTPPPGTRARVLDQDGNPAATGVPGRLSAGSTEADAERTGPWARRLPGGRLELLGNAGAEPHAEAARQPAAAACLDEMGRVWGEVLRIDPPGADASFFELGGHSLLVGVLTAHVRQKLDVTITLRDVFDHPRLGELAALVDERRGAAPERPRQSDGIPTPTGPLPASGFQERIWLAERAAPDRAVYNVVLAWRIRGPLSPEALRESLAVLVERHEILRTRFLDDDGRLVQRVEGPWRPEPELLDLTGLPSPARPEAVEGWLRAAALDPFDPAGGRLIRFALATLDDEERALLVCAHHLVLDGESVHVLASELAAAYPVDGNGPAGDGAVAPPHQYREFVAACELPEVRDRATAAVDFWSTRLAGAPARLPLPAPPRPEPDGAVVLDLPDDLLPRLRAVRTDRGTSWSMTVTTALAAALHRVTGSGDITFGMPVAHLSGGTLPGLIGPRLGTAIVRSTCRDGQSLGELLDAVRESVLLLDDHPGAPLEELVARLRPPRSSGSTPFADVLLNMSSRSTAPVPIGPAVMTPFLSDERFDYDTKFGLTVTVIQDGDLLRAGLSYRGDRFSSEDVRLLGSFLTALLDDFAGRLDTPVDDLALPVPSTTTLAAADGTV